MGIGLRPGCESAGQATDFLPATRLPSTLQTPRRAKTGRRWRGNGSDRPDFGDFDRCTTRSWAEYGPGRMQHNFCHGLLAPQHRDHPLSGTWADHRDCHVKPDLVLLYQKPDAKTLLLVRLGSHAKLELA